MLDLDDLFKGEQSRYWYGNGVNMKAVYTWLISLALPVLGLPRVLGGTNTFFRFFGENGWLVGFILALLIYPALMKNETGSLISEEVEEQITERVKG